MSWDKQHWVDSMPSFSFNTFPQYNFVDQYGQLYYIVTYRNNNGAILYEDYVKPGYSSSYQGPQVPSIMPYSNFVGWANYIVWDEDLSLNIPEYTYDLGCITESITVYPMHN